MQGDKGEYYLAFPQERVGLLPIEMAARGLQRLSKLPILPKKRTAEGEPLPLVYRRRVRCVAGSGGDGMVSFFRGFRKPFGGPDGGDGGNGGHIIFRASNMVGDLSHIRTELKAQRGQFGRSKSQHGKNAEHLEVDVPIGTRMKDPATLSEICQLRAAGEMFLAARGGAGGHGNQFYVSNATRKPFKAEIGGVGEMTELEVEMAVMARAALVGFPNAGKSSLLRAISRARPKVASYPFTTLNPHVGVVHYEDHEQISVADIPGLIEGSHANIGLGHDFLSHLTRCSLLIYVIDVSLGDCKHQRDALRNELHLYSPALARKTSTVLLNKVDIGTAVAVEKARRELEVPCFPLSAKTGEGIIPFLIHLREETENFVMAEN